MKIVKDIRCALGMHANKMFRLWIWQNIAFWKKGTHNES